VKIRDGRATVTGSIRPGSQELSATALPCSGTPDPVEEPPIASGDRSVRRLLLLRHAPTAATRAFAFPADESLDERGLAAAAELRLSAPSGHELLCSPAARCVQTAEAAGLGTPALDTRLAECDFGAWAGRDLDAITAEDPESVSAWMAGHDARPHGGESLAAFAARVGGWLAEQARLDGSAVVITHGGVVKAAVIAALAAPIASFWRVDASPLGVTELHAHDGRWTVTKVNAASGAVAEVPA